MFGRNNRDAADIALEAHGFYDQGDFGRALIKANQAISIEPRNVELHLLKIDILFNSNDLEEALKELKLIESLDSKEPSTYSMESLCYLDMNQYDKALESAEKAISIDPDYPFSYYNRALALNNLGRTDDAINAYIAASEKNPSDADSHRDLGEIYMKRGKYAMALRELKIALRFEKDDDVTNDLISTIKLDTGDINGYIESLKSGYENTGNVFYLIKLTDFLKTFGNLKDAENMAKTFLENDRDNIDLATNLARVYNEENRISDADDLFQSIIDRNDNEENNLGYVAFLDISERYESILSIIDEKIKEYPDNERFLYYKFYAFSKTGDHERALPIIKGLYESYKEFPDYAIAYALELSYIGQSGKSLKILDSIKSSYDDSELYTSYYKIYADMKQYTEAMKSLKISINHMDNIDDIAELLNDSIGDSLEKGYQDEMLKFMDNTIASASLPLLDLYRAQRACLLAVMEDYRKAERAMDLITDKKKVCFIIDRYLDFHNEKINNFLEYYYKSNCNKQ
jgi:tetratricopeptide (TPR) repeat protein